MVLGPKKRSFRSRMFLGPGLGSAAAFFIEDSGCLGLLEPSCFSIVGLRNVLFCGLAMQLRKFWSKIGSPNTCEAMGKRVKAMPFHSKASKSSKPEPRNMRDKTRRSVMTGLNGLKAPAVSQLEKMQFDKSLFTPLLL